ncbi:universal stress protein [Amphritea sp. 1_MG-2023]|uniref:universal stress protein n=1 Tax=Amphritea sp. 1_MG-2023 TaxID=3062670 RepID=UPI0026E2A9C7|nr:universal stress protein [Amphritea sp. 1_MG-2023]MDO6565066.1 universal stress protein [Amphritea sp. 1_MG-2023]
MFNDILVAIDINHADQQRIVLNTAKELAVAHKARLHVVSIVPDISSLVGVNFSEKDRTRTLKKVDRLLHEYVADIVGGACPIQHIVDTGKVYEEILLLAKKLPINLIVMGAHKPSISDYLLGTNAARVTRYANCSVFIVRPDEVVDE